MRHVALAHPAPTVKQPPPPSGEGIKAASQFVMPADSTTSYTTWVSHINLRIQVSPSCRIFTLNMSNGRKIESNSWKKGAETDGRKSIFFPIRDTQHTRCGTWKTIESSQKQQQNGTKNIIELSQVLMQKMFRLRSLSQSLHEIKTKFINSFFLFIMALITWTSQKSSNSWPDILTQHGSVYRRS